jgi:hypothetical protein
LRHFLQHAGKKAEKAEKGYFLREAMRGKGCGGRHHFPTFSGFARAVCEKWRNTAFPLFPLFPEQSEKNGTTFTAFPRQILKKAC